MKFHDSTCPPLSANQIALADFLGAVPGLIPIEEFTSIGQVTTASAKSIAVTIACCASCSFAVRSGETCPHDL